VTEVVQQAGIQPATQQSENSNTKTLAERLGVWHPDGTVKWLNGLFFGEPGAGKTHLSGTSEDDPDNWLPALILDIDGGTDTLRFRKQLDITDPIRSIKQLQKVYDEIAADTRERMSRGLGCYYKSIHMDNVSELQKMDMNVVMEEEVQRASNPAKIDLHIPTQAAWGKNNERMRLMIRPFRDLPCHFICLAHSDDREDSATKLMRLWPALPGQLRTGASGFFSVVGYISVYDGPDGKPTRQIQFAKTRRVAAKDRFQVLPDAMMDNPTLPQIWDIIRNSGAKIVANDSLEVNNNDASQNVIEALSQATGANT